MTTKVQPTVAALKTMTVAELKAVKNGWPAMRGDVDAEEKKRKANADPNGEQTVDGEGFVDPELVDEPNEENQDVDPSEWPYGMQILKAAHGSLSDCIKGCGLAMGDKLENTTVKDGMKDIMDNLTGAKSAIEGLHATAYPKFPPLGKPKDDPDGESGEDGVQTDQADDEADAAALKAFLAKGTSQQYQVLGLAHRVKSMMAEKNLTNKQKLTLKMIDNDLRRLVSQAKALPKSAAKTIETPAAKVPDADEAARIELQRKLDELKASLKV